MPLVGSFIFPHGALALSKTALNVPVAAHRVHDACMEASKKIKELQPDIILLTTPHGVSLNEGYVLYGDAKAAGTAEWAGEWTEYKCEVDIAQEESQDLCNYLSSVNKSARFEIVTAFAPSETIQLRWGEVIPIWFIQKHCNVESGNAPDYIFFSMPRKRMDKAVEMIPELFDIGKQLEDYFSKLAERVVIVISGDLAHTHPHQEPNHPNPFGINEDASLMDSTLERWIKTQEKELLHVEAAKYIATYVCGFTGFVTLSGVISRKSWESSLICREHPTYYGMLVATFLPSSPPDLQTRAKRVKPGKPPHPIIG